MTQTPFTTGRLIHMYRAHAGDHTRREDARHAHWWIEELGALPLSELTTGRILQAVSQLGADGRSGSTVAFYLRFLRRVTAWGTGGLYFSVDPCGGIPLPKEPTRPIRVLTEEEEHQLCAALGRPYNLWVRFAILTGLKQSEQFTLLWRSVDLNRSTVLLPQGFTGAMVELSLPPAAVTILRALRQESPTSIWVFPDPHDPMRPADVHNFYDSRWTRTIARLGLLRLAWKDLRHTCGVRLAKQGIPVGEIATCLRQRELRQAYRYRAWMPGVAPKRNPPKPARVPVFADLTDTDLRALMDRAPTDPPLTFGDLCRFYAVHYLKQRPSRVQFERIYRNLFRQWEARPLADISRKEVRMWYMRLSHTPMHANKALTFLQRVYNVAVYQLEVYEGTNPAIKMPRFPSTPRDRFLSSEEVQRFMDGLLHLSPTPRAYFLTLLLTGARLSEARCLRWIDVEWSTRLWRKPRTKNGSSQFIKLPVQVLDVLARLPRTSEWVFPGDHGQPWSRSSVQKLWDKIRRQWNMQDVTIHDLRRTCASYLAIEGENLSIIQGVLNHKNLAHTATYARLNTHAVDRALQAQADRFSSPAEKTTLLPAPPPPHAPVPVAHATPPESAVSDDPRLNRLIWRVWARLPEVHATYFTASAARGVSVAHLLGEAMERRISDLEEEYRRLRIHRI